MEIINGVHYGSAIGYLTDPDGGYVPIYSGSDADLLAAMTRAIGPVPAPIEFGVGGELVAVTNDKGLITSYVYNPAGDERNKMAIGVYEARVGAWNARAAAIQEAVKVLLAKPRMAVGVVNEVLQRIMAVDRGSQHNEDYWNGADSAINECAAIVEEVFGKK